jgi:hypothetical protein
MDIKEALIKIKQIFEAAPPVAPVAPVDPNAVPTTDYILEDGTKVVIDKCEAGGTMTINGAPAPDGDHKLQDGTIIETAQGVITEITSPADPKNDDGVTTDMDSRFAAIDGKFTSYEQKFNDYETKFTAYESRFAAAEQTIVKQQSAIVQLLEVVEKLATTPAAEPAATPASVFTKEEAKEERFASILKAIEEIKK